MRTSRPLQAASARSAAGIQRTTSYQLGRRPGKATRLLWLLQLVPALLAAQNESLRKLFPPRPDNYLTDAAHVVDSQSTTAINDLAARLRTATGAELAVVTLPTIEDRAPGDVALAIGRAWGVGGRGEIGDSSRNAGIVLLLVPRTPEHRGEIYLATGRGIEGILTDAAAGRITDVMLPELREAQWGPALLLGTRAVAVTVAKGYGVSDSTLLAADPFQASGDEAPFNPFVGLIIAVIILLVIASIARRGGGGRGPRIFWGGGWGGGGWSSGGGWGSGGWGGGGGGGGFGGFGGGGGFSGGGAGRSF